VNSFEIILLFVRGDSPSLLTNNQARQRRNRGWFRSKALRPDCFTDQEIEAYCHEYSKPNRLTQGWAYYRTIPRTAEINRQFATKPLAMPVLAIGGSNSAGLNLARAITQSTPGVVGEVIAESGHFVPEEQPERTIAVLLGALSAANL
jgi:pimeloyl-ACP methyl ester carboxylesterase